MIIDSYNRPHQYLRISLTDNCNLRCFYCMPEEDYEFTPAPQLMTAPEIQAIAKVFVEEGVNKIRLTGGEPLVRKEAPAIIASLASLPAELTITTNATRLHRFADLLQQSGVRSVNISLDTLNENKFEMITRRNQFSVVKDNIALMLDKSFRVKVNMVVMRGINDNEINDFVRWTRHTPVEIRFIEFMPFSGNRWSSNKVFTMGEILDVIGKEFAFEPVQGEKSDTAKKFAVPGHAGNFAVISTMSAHFCGSCNRMRLTADGKLKNCLFSSEETDLLSALREGRDIRPLIHACIATKAEKLGGQLATNFEQVQPESIHNRSMIAIGG